jgi:hypothetical protein
MEIGDRIGNIRIEKRLGRPIPLPLEKQQATPSET